MKVSLKIAARLAVPALALMAACNQERLVLVSVDNKAIKDAKIETLWISTTPGNRGEAVSVTTDGGMMMQFPVQIGVYLSSAVTRLTVFVEATNAEGTVTVGKGQTDVSLGPVVKFDLFLCKDGNCMEGCPVEDAQGHLPDGGAVEAGPPVDQCRAFCELVIATGCHDDLFSTSLESCEAACTIAGAALNLPCRTMTLSGQDPASRCAAASVRDPNPNCQETSCQIYCAVGATACPTSFGSEDACNDKCPDSDLNCLMPYLAQAILNRSYCAQASPDPQCGSCRTRP